MKPKECKCGTLTTSDDGVCSDCFLQGKETRQCFDCTDPVGNDTDDLCWCCFVNSAQSDPVDSPSHYADHYPVEVKELIEVMVNWCDAQKDGLSAWEIVCLGNEFKYRLRAGFKGDAAEDIAKAMKYNEYRKPLAGTE